MTFLNWIFVAWSLVTAALAGLLIYRSILSMKEDDQLFLDPAEHQFEEEQAANLKALLRLTPYVKALASGSAGIFVVMAGYAVWTALY